MVKLEIVFDQATGDISVAGPMQNALLCYGMLEVARDIIARAADGKIDANAGGSSLIVPHPALRKL